jgi:hypothetical protein
VDDGDFATERDVLSGAFGIDCLGDARILRADKDGFLLAKFDESSLRDLFAGLALNGLTQQNQDGLWAAKDAADAGGVTVSDVFAKIAYAAADAMLARRKN